MANDGSYIKLLKNDTVFNLAADQTACIDVNGKKTTISGSGTLQGADSANDAYKTSVGAATVADTVTIAPDAAVNGNRYIAIADNGRATFHRLNMRLTTVSLRTASCGIYYKAKYECDDTLAAKVDSYGVVFSVKNMPGADFKTELADNNRYTTLTPDASFGDGTVATSGSIFNIMKTAYDAGGDVAQSNAARGEMPIYANAYVVVSGKTFVADTANANKKVTDEGFNKGVAYSMLDVLKLIDTLKGRLSRIHLKDFADKPADGSITTVAYLRPIYEGKLDYDAYIKALKAAGTEYMLVEQDWCYEEDEFGCLRRSFVNVTNRFPEAK